MDPGFYFVKRQQYILSLQTSGRKIEALYGFMFVFVFQLTGQDTFSEFAQDLFGLFFLLIAENQRSGPREDDQ